MFYDRIEAAHQLVRRLRKYKNDKGVVLAVPKGGIPLAYIVAKELELPLDIVLTKKIGHPLNKEYAIGAVSLAGTYIIPHPEVPQTYLNTEVEKIQARLKDMYHKFMGEKEPVDIAGRTVIIIDDGVATGNTLLATIQMLRKDNPAKIVVAVPVASHSSYVKLLKQADEMISLLVPDNFYGVSAFYEHFSQVTDEEALSYLHAMTKVKATSHS